MRQKLFWVFAGIICSSTAAVCQVITGNIVGQITDASGALVPNVAIVVRDSGTGISVTVQGDDSGVYSAPNLRPGLYDISARKEGFRTETVTGVQLLAQQTARLDFKLGLATLQESIEVAAQPQMVHTDSQTIHSSINQRQLTDLPTTSLVYRWPDDSRSWRDRLRQREQHFQPSNLRQSLLGQYQLQPERRQLE
jgi:hypothetical protein